MQIKLDSFPITTSSAGYSILTSVSYLLMYGVIIKKYSSSLILIKNNLFPAGEIPQRTANISHPGICEPTDSADCLNKNGWTIDCSEGADFTCAGIDDPGKNVIITTLTRSI